MSNPVQVSRPGNSQVSAQGQDKGRVYTSSDNGEGIPDSTESDEKVSKAETRKLDAILSRLTSAFPLFVLGSAIAGFLVPSTLEWVNRGEIISLMLACVMLGTGMTLEKRDFTEVLARNFASVPAGVLCQFCIMPATAFVVGRTMLLDADPVLGPALFLGLALVGCSPGGTASNLVSLIARADVALSVLLTSCSTILAAIATPLLVKLLVGKTVRLSGMALCSATARVVLMPVILGMFLNAMAPDFSRYISRFTPFASVLLVSLICGGVVSNNAPSLFGSSSTSLLPRIIGSVLSLHTIGFLLGYLVPRLGLRYSEKTARTISIETGMQNSALAVVLVQSIGAHPLAALPGALSATTHSCLGSILAAYWRYNDSRRASNEKEMNEAIKE
jgi:BASS family bile acid:Na+ symporter